MPYEIAAGTASVALSVYGVTSPAQPVTVAPAAPGIFLDGSGDAVAQNIAQNADGTVNSAAHPAPAGGYLTVYITGGGAVDHPPGTGQAASFTTLSRFLATATATIGGINAPVTFAGLTPGFAGLGQVNVQVPNLPSGTYPLVIQIGGQASNSGQVSISAAP